MVGNANIARLSVLAVMLSFCSYSFVCAAVQVPGQAESAEIVEATMKAAVQRVAPSVVQIETSGGTDLIGAGTGEPQIRKGAGPTTGLIVAPDGYIITSAFNFANKPSAIFVAVPGQKNRLVAKEVATDQTRMLTLIKIEKTGLSVPLAAPKSEIVVGRWSLALGRTWSDPQGPPSVSVGIVSALNRIWNKAIQTDAKVSPVNYGGPLVDLQGRVQGVLVPASPRGEGETAGVEWYDSGIGFAIPLEDVNTVLPRLKKGKDLKRGLLGITVRGNDIYGDLPVVATVSPYSAAAKAGIKPGDQITEIDHFPIIRQAQILHVLGAKYEGDKVEVKVKRAGKEISWNDLELSAQVTSFSHPFLGILPLRDDPEPGVEVRSVFPKSPAAKIGIKAGDRIVKAGKERKGLAAVANRDRLTDFLNTLTPETEIVLEIRKKGDTKTEIHPVTLAPFSSDLLPDLPDRASAGKALTARAKAAGNRAKPEDTKKAVPKKEKGIVRRSNTAHDHEYWFYVPENYNPEVSHALVLWLHPPGKRKEKDDEAFTSIWENFCSVNHAIILGPRATNETGWLFSDADFILESIREITAEYTIDPQRLVVHGHGLSGQMAIYFGFHARDVVRGVVTIGSVMGGNRVYENVAGQRLSFFVVAGEKDPLLKLVRAMKDKLAEQRFSVVYRELPDMGSQYLEAEDKILKEISLWIDSLDRL